MLDISDTQEIYTISRLNREVRFIVEGSFPSLWVEGEISNFVVPQSGHWYFSLKDQNAQVRCAMFKLQNKKCIFLPKDGTHVLAKARVSLYEGRGEFQLLIDYLEDAGIGKLQKEFAALKKKLADLGLFDPLHKKAIPSLPKRIGIITSPTGAAIRDILHVINRRFPCVPIVIYPTLVQGAEAAPQVVAALQCADRRQECDVLILARGGGSLEDLWPFNEESVAQAIFKCSIPIISGVGHEIDFTIADFVADVRAPTPSAAAELATPDLQDLLGQLRQKQQQMLRWITQKTRYAQATLDWAGKHLQQLHPQKKLTMLAQQLDNLEIHLKKHIRLVLKLNQQELAQLAAQLNALSPLSTLRRGFAIATVKQKVLHSVSQVTLGDTIQVQLTDGLLDCEISKIT